MNRDLDFKIGDRVRVKSGCRPEEVATIAEIIAGGTYATLLWKQDEQGNRFESAAPLQDLELVSIGPEPQQ